VHVSAKDLGTGKEQKIRIESSSGLSKDEVEKLVKEGQANAEEDKKKHEVITARNQLDNLIYATEKTLKEHGDKISEDEKKKVEEALKEAKTSVTSESKEELEKASQKLGTASHTIAQKMYEEAAKKAGNKGPATPGAEGASKKDEGVVDADYEVVDEEEKKKKKE
jgi:molecular chaperone DnaK